MSDYWGQFEWMKRIFSFIIPMKDRIEKEEHRMKIVKDLFKKFNLKDGECDNFYYLNVLIYFKHYFFDLFDSM